MAQVTVKKTLLATALAGALALASASALGQALPEAGLAAEARQDWPEAARIYRDVLAAQPDHLALWQRLAQIEAAAGNTTQAADALGRVAALLPADAGAQSVHSSALAMDNRPTEALTAIQRALALQPDNVDYLLAQSQLANWTGDAALALDSLERAVALAPERTDLLDDIARSHAWQGDLTGAIALMDVYLSSHPDDRVARLDRVYFVTWRGDYARAIEALDVLESDFGADAASQSLRARMLAWAARRHQSLAINTPLLAAAPDDYQLNYTQVLALRQGMIPAQAQPYLDTVRRLQPDSRETADLSRSTRVIQASRISAYSDFFEDSDDIRTIRYGVNARLALDDRWWLLASAGENRVRAPIAGQFAPPSGGNNVRDRRGTVGLRHALNADLAVTARAGVSDLDTRSSTGLLSLEIEGLPSDTFGYLVALERDRVSASPKPLDLGITREGAHSRVQVRPTLRDTFDAGASYDEYSDDNERVNLDAAWRHAVMRGPRLQLDLGLSGEWLHFDKDPGNGYYSPDSYRRFSAIGGAYVPITDDSGLSIQLGVGIQRDEDFNNWERASDVSIEYTTGIFKDWQLKVRAGYAERVQNTGAFEGSSLSINIERRF